jgi:Caspase domain/inactive STAND/Effector-associated domain 9
MTQSSTPDIQPIQRRYAFLVGINSYVEPRLSSLNFCVEDVKALETLLTELGYIVVSMYDQHPQQHRQPIRGNVKAELKQLCQQLEKNDLLFVHFACHGKVVGSKRILMMQDSRLALLEEIEERLTVEDVQQMMRDSKATRFFLSLDACHTGVEMGRGDDDLEFIRNVYELAEGFVVMAGSTAQQKAMEWKAVKHGVYTYYLLKALSGEADRANKSFVSVDDVEKHVIDQLKRWGVAMGLLQEPTIEKSGMGDMILADWRDRTPPSISMPAPAPQTQEFSSAISRSEANPLPDFEQKRREKLRLSLQSDWDTRTEKLARLRQALAIESDVSRQFQLEKQIQMEEKEIQDLEIKLSEIEQGTLSEKQPMHNQVAPSGGLSPAQIEKRELEKRYANLTTKYQSLGEQIEGELNSDDRFTLQERRKLVKREMDEVWESLQGLRRSSDDRTQQYLTFKEDLPKIDFDEVMDGIDDLIQSFRTERGDALLLLQESLSMSGDLCLQRIRDEFKSKTGNFRFYELEFYSGEELNDYGWLHGLSGYFGLTVGSKPEELAKLVIEKICQSVKSGSTIFLEIRKWDDLPCQEDTLAWFMKHFWIPLVQCLDDRTAYPRVKFIAVIVVDDELSPACFAESCLAENQVVPFRWLNLPLRNWREDEIQEWLETYPGIGNPRSINLSNRFFKASKKGVPSLVCHALEKELLLKES